MGKEVDVYRWKRNQGQLQWVCKHRDDSKDFLKPEEIGGTSGKSEGDWLLNWKNSSYITLIPAHDMFDDGTLWRWDNSKRKWSSIYQRSTQGYKDLPWYLAEIEGEDGDVIVESGIDKTITVYDKHGEAHEYEEEVVAVLELQPSVEEAPKGKDLDVWGVAPKEKVRSENRLDDTIAPLAEQADAVISFLANVSDIAGEWAGWKKDEKLRKKLLLALVKTIEEANPSPTPGTTAVNDYRSLVNDMIAGEIEYEDGLLTATGIDDNGESLDCDGKAEIDYFNTVAEVLQGLGAMTSYIRSLRTIVKTEYVAPGTHTGNTQFEGELNTAAATGSVDSIKIVTNLFAASTRITEAVASGSQAASAMSSVSSGVPFASSVVGVLTFYRHSRKAHRARKRWWMYRKMLKGSVGQPYGEDLQHCLEYAVGKSGRRLRTQAATAATAVVSTTGGTILGVTAVVGGANAWNPVGWVLLGTAAVGGAGIVGYKVYKRWKRKKRHAKREKKYGGIKTPEDLGKKLVEIASGGSARDAEAAKSMLRSFGVDTNELGQDGVLEASMAMVKRHLTK